MIIKLQVQLFVKSKCSGTSGCSVWQLKVFKVVCTVTTGLIMTVLWRNIVLSNYFICTCLQRRIVCQSASQITFSSKAACWKLNNEKVILFLFLSPFLFPICFILIVLLVCHSLCYQLLRTLKATVPTLVNKNLYIPVSHTIQFRFYMNRCS